jgi:hypothetical protein
MSDKSAPDRKGGALIKIAASILFLISIVITISPCRCRAADDGWQAVGIRGGISATPKHEFFHQYEAFAVYGLPWEWRASSGWGLVPQLNTTAGALISEGETVFIGSAGPGLSLDKTGSGLALDAGVNVVVLSNDTFGEQDFNGLLQFMAHVGLTYHVDGGMGLGYRFQHLSNGHIYGRGNPGLDLHMVGLSWHF